jgi:hypothetical protein
MRQERLIARRDADIDHPNDPAAQEPQNASGRSRVVERAREEIAEPTRHGHERDLLPLGEDRRCALRCISSDAHDQPEFRSDRPRLLHEAGEIAKCPGCDNVTAPPQ